MTKIEEILEKYKTKTDHYADQEWQDSNVEKAMIEYSKIYAVRCIEDLFGGFCQIESNKLIYISPDNTIKYQTDLPAHE